MKTKILFLFSILLVVIFWGIVNGPSNFSFQQLLQPQNHDILWLRLSRVSAAIILGVGLSVSGIALQAILRNPLAEPYLLGTSSGAGLGAVIALITGIGAVYLPLAAFIGAIFTVFLVYNLARQQNKVPVQALVLSGVIVSIAFSAIMVFLISLSSNEALHGAMWWLWGSTQVYDARLLTVVGITVFLSVLVIYFFAQDLNAISIGEEEAMHLGIDSEALKKILFFITSLITACAVSLCGIIGFVGLVIPHIMRRVVGPNHKVLIPATCITASIFMITCDIISRTMFSPLEIPIGVITAVIGAPIFIILLKKKQRIT